MGASGHSRLFLLLALASLLLSGALGLKFPGDCDRLTPQEKIYCFHEEAITAAYTSQSSRAADVCNQITAAVSGVGGDVTTIAETEKNICLVDIAKITKDASICERIPDAGPLELLQGSSATKSICRTKVNSLKHADPAVYFNRPDSLCNISFIFPLIVGIVALKNRF